MHPPLIVLKLGSSVLRDATALPHAVDEIYRHVRQGTRVVAIVSALGDTTECLQDEARRDLEHPDPAATAALLATGEATTAALLALELDRHGVPATVLSPAVVGPSTSGPALGATPVDLDVDAILATLAARPVAVLPGFIGRDRTTGAVTTLGPGGSDLTAVFVAHRVGAERCILLKDVDGLYDHDPARESARPARRFARLGWQEALELNGEILQSHATLHAREVGLSFEVGAPGEARQPTSVGAHLVELESAHGSQVDAVTSPIRVTLLGLGNVGLGVYHRLASVPERFEIAGVLVRDASRERGVEVPRDLLSTDADEVLARPADVVVELLGGVEPAFRLCRRALEGGASVVTANKAVLAAHGQELSVLALREGGTLSFSAAVAGAVPALETVQRIAAEGGVRSIEAVLNGTANFVLDRIVGENETLGAAVSAAQAQGLAEADPTLDLDGGDSAEKLALLAVAAFPDLALDPACIPVCGITCLDPALLRREREAGWVHRLVACCRRRPDGLLAWVAPTRLPVRHPLARARREDNRLLIEPEVGASVLVCGKGAGRWPTTLAVMADLNDELHRLRRDAPAQPCGVGAIHR